MGVACSHGSPMPCRATRRRPSAVGSRCSLLLISTQKVTRPQILFSAVGVIGNSDPFLATICPTTLASRHLQADSRSRCSRLRTERRNVTVTKVISGCGDRPRADRNFTIPCFDRKPNFKDRNGFCREAVPGQVQLVIMPIPRIADCGRPEQTDNSDCEIVLEQQQMAQRLNEPGQNDRP